MKSDAPEVKHAIAVRVPRPPQLYRRQHEDEYKKHHLKKVVALSATSVLALAAVSAAVGAAVARAVSRSK